MHVLKELYIRPDLIEDTPETFPLKVDADGKIVKTLDPNIDNKVGTIHIYPSDLSGNGTEEQQICEWLNNNIRYLHSKSYSKLNFVIDENPFPRAFRFPYRLPLTLS
jgi:hypothetical protein